MKYLHAFKISVAILISAYTHLEAMNSICQGLANPQVRSEQAKYVVSYDLAYLESNEYEHYEPCSLFVGNDSLAENPVWYKGPVPIQTNLRDSNDPKVNRALSSYWKTVEMCLQRPQLFGISGVSKSIWNVQKNLCESYVKTAPPVGVCNASASTAKKFYNQFGTGTTISPHQIYNAKQLYDLSIHPEGFGKEYVQCSNIDMNTIYAEGKPYFTIGGDTANSFTGKYDGQGYAIMNWKYLTNGPNYQNPFSNSNGTLQLRSSNKNIGLFSKLSGDSRVSRLSMLGTQIYLGISGPSSGLNSQVGAIAGSIEGGKLEYLSVSSDTSIETTFLYNTSSLADGHRVAALVGYAEGNVSIFYVQVGGVVQGTEGVGGIVGTSGSYGAQVKIERASSTIKIPRCNSNCGGLIGFAGQGTILRTSSAVSEGITGILRVGGAIGKAHQAFISGVSASGPVSGDSEVGGFSGWVQSSQFQCASSDGSVTVTNADPYQVGARAGGFGAYFVDSTVQSARSSANVQAVVPATTINDVIYTGGFVGEIYDTTISNAFATGQVESSHSKTGGFIGHNYGTIENAYASGKVLQSSGATEKFGGFVGFNQGTIQQVFSTGDVLTSLSANIGEAVGFSSGTLTSVAYDANAECLLDCNHVGTPIQDFSDFFDPNANLNFNWQTQGPQHAWVLFPDRLPSLFFTCEGIP